MNFSNWRQPLAPERFILSLKQSNPRTAGVSRKFELFKAYVQTYLKRESG